ncbi:MAG: glycosyltransferase family 2 protein, partial [Thermoanaerobaculia bacterium]|nr:glycosyltransferase family 2 protein [Thermoanaerobaculia bacterium]
MRRHHERAGITPGANPPPERTRREQLNVAGGAGLFEPKLVPRLSVVIPVLNEERNVRPLCQEVREALESRLSYEIIFVDDGSTDKTVAMIRSLMKDGRVRLLRHSERRGQSAAIRTGVRAASGRWIATLDGDGQNDPRDLLELWQLVTATDVEVGLVNGIRETREDGHLKRVASRIANRVRGTVLSDGCPDSGCGIRVFARDAFLDLPSFDHMHRFLPALFRARGHEVLQVPVHHRPRRYGLSKYGIRDRLWVGIVDLIGVAWLGRRSRSMIED